MNKKNFIALMLFSIIAFSFRLPQEKTDKEVYEKNCVKCHGHDGTKGKFKAKDLQKSVIKDADILTLLKTGKKVMPNYSKKLSEKEMNNVIAYTKTLRK